MFLVAAVIAIVLITALAVVVTINTPFSCSAKVSAATDSFIFGDDTTVTEMRLTVERARPLLKPEVQIAMQQLLRTVTELMNGAEIEHWAVRSTMLAAVLHESLIPWDDSIDIAIDHKNVARLVGLRSMLESRQYLLHSVSNGYRVCANNFARYPFVHVHIASVVDNDVVSCTPLSELGQCTYKDSHRRRREIYNVADVFPLRKAKLGDDLEISIPVAAEACLDVWFGHQNWRTTLARTTGLPFFWNSYTKSLLRRLTLSTYNSTIK